MQIKTGLALATALGAATLFGLGASAQQAPGGQAPASPPAQNEQAPASPATPDSAKSTPDAQSGSGDRAGSTEGRGRRWGEGRRWNREGRRGDRHHWRRHREGRRYGRGHRRGGRFANMSEADRKAFFEARIAAIKAGLMLNETQARLWPPVESAIRDMAKQRQEWRERIRKEGRPSNPVDRMKRRGEMLSARGDALTKYANAAKPLYDSLDDDQKRRLRMMMRRYGGGFMGMGPRRSGMMRRGAKHRRYGHHGFRGRHHGRFHGRHHERRFGMRGERRWGEGRRRGDHMRPRGRDMAMEGEGFDRGNGLADWRKL